MLCGGAYRANEHLKVMQGGGVFGSAEPQRDAPRHAIKKLANPFRIANAPYKSRRTKRRIGNFNAYKRQAAAEYEQAREKLLLGSSGAASPVRKIDPATGAVIEILKSPNST
jgi:hypothetical protein